LRKVRLVHLPEVANALREASDALLSMEARSPTARVADARAAGMALAKAAVAMRHHVDELESWLSQDT